MELVRLTPAMAKSYVGGTFGRDDQSSGVHYRGQITACTVENEHMLQRMLQVTLTGVEKRDDRSKQWAGVSDSGEIVQYGHSLRWYLKDKGAELIYGALLSAYEAKRDHSGTIYLYNPICPFEFVRLTLPNTR